MQNKVKDKQREIRNKAIPIFVGLKVAEIGGLALGTVGVYFYGALTYYLLRMVRPGIFLTWLTGLAALFATLATLIIAYLLIGKCWLIPNWNWAKKIAEKKIGGKK